MQFYEREMANDGVKNLTTLFSERIHMMTQNFGPERKFHTAIKNEFD
jgi:hypothetical protein